jgi:hypothetical protein
MNLRHAEPSQEYPLSSLEMLWIGRRDSRRTSCFAPNRVLGGRLDDQRPGPPGGQAKLRDRKGFNRQWRGTEPFFVPRSVCVLRLVYVPPSVRRILPLPTRNGPFMVVNKRPEESPSRLGVLLAHANDQATKPKYRIKNLNEGEDRIATESELLPS